MVVVDSCFFAPLVDDFWGLHFLGLFHDVIWYVEGSPPLILLQKEPGECATRSTHAWEIPRLHPSRAIFRFSWEESRFLLLLFCNVPDMFPSFTRRAPFPWSWRRRCDRPTKRPRCSQSSEWQPLDRKGFNIINISLDMLTTSWGLVFFWVCFCWGPNYRTSGGASAWMDV